MYCVRSIPIRRVSSGDSLGDDVGGVICLPTLRLWWKGYWSGLLVLPVWYSGLLHYKDVVFPLFIANTTQEYRVPANEYMGVIKFCEFSLRQEARENPIELHHRQGIQLAVLLERTLEF
jgi:hypothetical protein